MIDKIECIITINEVFSRGDIDLALEELGFTKEERVNWKKVKELYQENMKERLEWFKGEYSWLWFIDAIKNAKREEELTKILEKKLISIKTINDMSISIIHNKIPLIKGVSTKIALETNLNNIENLIIEIRGDLMAEIDIIKERGIEVNKENPSTKTKKQ